MIDSPPLDEAALRAELIGTGLGWRRLDVVERTGSTNADLLARAAQGTDVAGSVLIAEHQTAGRGRHGRGWVAGPRAQVTMSVGVSVVDVPVPGWGWLPLATGVAVVDALATEGVQAGLKWPNDVLADGRKLAGILAEVSRPVVVIGLGLNVFGSPDGVDGATSLVDLGVDGMLVVEVSERQEVPPLLRNLPWAANGVVAYRVHWEPADVTELEAERPSLEHRVARGRTSPRVQAIARGLHEAVGGEVADEADFLVDPADL